MIGVCVVNGGSDIGQVVVHVVMMVVLMVTGIYLSILYAWWLYLWC